MTCPLCGGGMVEREEGRVQLDLCGPCRSLWFDRNELKAYLGRFKAGRAALERFFLESQLGPEEDRPRCPCCLTDTLVRLARGKIVLFQCSHCRGILLKSGSIPELLKAPTDRAAKLMAGIAEEGIDAALGDLLLGEFAKGLIELFAEFFPDDFSGALDLDFLD